MNSRKQNGTRLEFSRRKRRRWLPFLLTIAVLLLLGGGLLLSRYMGWLPEKTYTAADFNLTTAVSPVDFNQNGADDYADFISGAKQDAKNHPRYNGAYYEGGYPTDNIGVCTDVVWRAFRAAGYSLKDMVDADIRSYPERYPNIAAPDPNIDFRRVGNLHAFFEAYAVSLTTDIHEIEEWQPGDIVIFNGDKHIGIVSDLRNADGQPYILHNGGQPKREENYLPRAKKITAHYRFDASRLPEGVAKTY